MKKILLTLFAATGLLLTSFAQKKASEKVVIQTPTIQCDMCKERIEKYLSREPGISAVKVDLKKKTTTVTYLTDRNNIEQIRTAIANIGYDADGEAAEESAYKKLPKCCRKPAEPAKAVEGTKE
jgi:mercuric ion binding protein